MLFPRRFTIIGGGGGGGTNTIGTPSDGTYEDGLLDFTPTTTIGDAVDEINELLKYIAPEPPKPLSGNLQLSVTPRAGYISNYTNLGTLTPGQQHNLIVNTNTFTATTQNSERFSEADKGELRLYKNDTLIDSFNLESNFNESEREGCQSYPPANSTNGYITILSVCWYNNFPAYQKGQARVNFNSSIVDVGYNKFQLKHIIGASTNQTNEQIIYYDDAPRPSIDNLDITLNTPQYKYLSGIKYFDRNTSWNISISASGIFDKTYVQQPIVISGSGIVTMNIDWNDSNASGFSNPPNYNDPWNYSSVIPFNKDDAGDTVQFNVTPRDPFGNGTTQNVIYNNYLYNTYNIKSTDTHEYFVDEYYRLPLGDYDSVPSNITGQWDSTQPLTNGNAQVYIDRLIYPHENFNNGIYNPTQDPGRDYSTFTGDQVYIRAIRDNGTPHNSGSLHIRGITWDNVGSDVELYLKLPGQTGWLDLSKDFSAAGFSGSDGDGCMTSHSQQGDVLVINWSSSYYSTASSGYMYILKIVLKNTNIEILELWDFE